MPILSAVPLSAVYQAHRYVKLGFPNLFVLDEQKQRIIDLIGGMFGLQDWNGVYVTSSCKAWERHLEKDPFADIEDVNRVATQVADWITDGTYMIVAPFDAELEQLKSDGILIHPLRLDAFLCAMECIVERDIAASNLYNMPASPQNFSADLTRHQLKIQALYIVKTC